MYRVNPKHRVTEERAKFLPMHRKLRMYFAESACKHAMKKNGDIDPSEIETEEPEKKPKEVKEAPKV